MVKLQCQAVFRVFVKTKHPTVISKTKRTLFGVKQDYNVNFWKIPKCSFCFFGVEERELNSSLFYLFTLYLTLFIDDCSDNNGWN